jgi:hypothetical protein
MFEDAQLQHVGDDFEGLQSQQLGEFSHLDVIGYEDPLARFPGFEQIPGG